MVWKIFTMDGQRSALSVFTTILTTASSRLSSSTEKSCTAELIANTKNVLGECIIYDDKANRVVWTDIYGKTFNSLCLDTLVIYTHPLHKQLSAFGLLSNESEQGAYLCAWEDGFQLYDIINDKPISGMSVGECVTPLGKPTRLNDGRCDRTGKRFICGGFYGDVKGNTMKVFKCEYDEANKQLSHCELDSVKMPDLEVTNSTCFSPDGRIMYFANSPEQIIYAYTYDSVNGRCSEKKEIWKASVGVPDGSCVDADGFIWNAVWRDGYGPGMVNRIDPSNGEVVYTIYLPDGTSQVSCCCFGGRNLDILFISTAAVGRDSEKEPNAGGVYAVKLPFIGLPESRFIV